MRGTLILTTMAMEKGIGSAIGKTGDSGILDVGCCREFHGGRGSSGDRAVAKKSMSPPASRSAGFSSPKATASIKE